MHLHPHSCHSCDSVHDQVCVHGLVVSRRRPSRLSSGMITITTHQQHHMYIDHSTTRHFAFSSLAPALVSPLPLHLHRSLHLHLPPVAALAFAWTLYISILLVFTKTSFIHQSIENALSCSCGGPQPTTIKRAGRKFIRIARPLHLQLHLRLQLQDNITIGPGDVGYMLFSKERSLGP